METVVVKADNDNAMPLALETLRSGNLVAFPTDTVYGLAADPFNITAIIKLFESKGREYNKAIAILVGSMDQVDLIAENFTENARKLTAKFWPGGLTVIVPKRKDIPDLLSSNQSIGIRMLHASQYMTNNNSFQTAFDRLVFFNHFHFQT